MSIATRIVAPPLIAIAVMVMGMALLDRIALTQLDRVEHAATAAKERAALAAEAYSLAAEAQGDVAAHLALAGSGLEDALLIKLRQGAERRLAQLAPLAAQLDPALPQLTADYAKAAAQINEMAAIDRLIAIPLMAHVGERHAVLIKSLEQAKVKAQSEGAVAASDARRQAESARSVAIGAGVVVVTVLLIVCLGAARSVTGPLGRMTETMRRLADGDTAVDVDRAQSGQMGALARAIGVFRDNALSVARMAEERAAADARLEEEKRAAVRRLADGFETNVNGVVTAVATAAGDMRGGAEELAAAARRAAELSAAIARAADDARDGVSDVNAAADRLSRSVADVGRQVVVAAGMAASAVGESQGADAAVAGLAEAAQRIGDVTRIIGDIAGQTNLLALNATIEAARAGEAGRGFAVVASEVKTLAGQTARAVEEITQQIHGMQAAAGGAVGAIRGVGEVIDKLSAVAHVIAEAVDAQRCEAERIAANLARAAAGAADVSRHVDEASAAAEQTGGAAQTVLAAAVALSNQSNHLRQETDAFVAAVRAG